MIEKNHSIAIALLSEFVDKSPRADGLTSQKVNFRSTVFTPDPSLPNIVQVEIERHRAASGERYVGAAMSAFYTYFMRFDIDVETGAIKELEPREDGLTIVDIGGLAETYLDGEVFGLHVVGLETGGYEIREDCSKDFAVILSENQAVEFALQFTDVNVDMFVEQLDANISDQDRLRLVEKFTRAVEEVLISKGKQAWENRDELD